MERPCDACAAPYEALRSTSKFCSDRCKKRAQRGFQATAAVVPATGAMGTSNVTAVTAELESAGRLDTWLGAAALSIAQRMDKSTAVMGYAALVKELRSTMDAALAGVKVAADPVDELRSRRDRKFAG